MYWIQPCEVLTTRVLVSEIRGDGLYSTRLTGDAGMWGGDVRDDDGHSSRTSTR